MFDGVTGKEYVKKYIDLAGADMHGDNAIPALQLRGVTALCRILNGNRYAYLADEVGMGKTYQAIGVIEMLLIENPDAKVLVIAPSEAVQLNWWREIGMFNANKLTKDGVKIDARYTHPADLIQAYRRGEDIGNVSVVRLTSFSTIAYNVARRNKEGRSAYRGDNIARDMLQEGISTVVNEDIELDCGDLDTREAGRLCGQIFRGRSPKFDLVIVDEAQNIRNENNATVFLSNWLALGRFRKEDDTDTSNTKFLLMSATPAHRSKMSLQEQIRYFESDEDKLTIDREHIQKYLIRRLRTYIGGKNKNDIRSIHGADVARGMGAKQELFLALVQTRLARLGSKSNATFKIGFLETFESYKCTEGGTEADEEDEEGNRDKEFENGLFGERGAAPDKMMLKNIARSYSNAEFNDNDYPPHPKFGYMENEIKGLLTLDTGSDEFPGKALVFVRRLASVDELVDKRLRKLYEDNIIERWCRQFAADDAKYPDGSGKKREYKTLADIRSAFQNLYDKADRDAADEEEVSDEDDETENIDEFTDWLKYKKKDDSEYDAVSKFKKSLTRNAQRCWLFDENYLRTYYLAEKKSERGFDKYVKARVDDVLVDTVNRYVCADRSRFVNNYKNKKKNSDLLALCCYAVVARKDGELAREIKEFFRFPEPAETCLTKEVSKSYIIKILRSDRSLWDRKELDGLNRYFNVADFKKREFLKSLIEKYLKSSEAVLEMLYGICYGNAFDGLFSKNSPHGKRIERLLEDDNAELVCKQLELVVGIDGIDYKYDPRFMNNQSWVVGAKGGDKSNPDKINRFNTPFYPDIIVCTDVFKEGINLHLFCNRVYHYGLAWTPGDMEQRIGRVDRFFSKTYRAISKGKNTKIGVVYPYMGKTIDEQQLKRVLKFKAEADFLMDTKDDRKIKPDYLEIQSVDKLLQGALDKDIQTDSPYSGDEFL